MTRTSPPLLVWLPRILGIAVALCLGVFALDAFDEGGRALAMHAAPSLLILAIVGIGWKYPWVAAAAFMGMGGYYAASVQRLDWIVVIATPLFIVGLLFLASGTREPRRQD
jgi:hypothetical protein